MEVQAAGVVVYSFIINETLDTKNHSWLHDQNIFTQIHWFVEIQKVRG